MLAKFGCSAIGRSDRIELILVERLTHNEFRRPKSRP
jgi:hypothetical protein